MEGKDFWTSPDFFRLEYTEPLPSRRANYNQMLLNVKMFRVSVSDNPDSKWEVVLSGSLAHRWGNSEPLPLPIEELDLKVGVVEKQFVKFEAELSTLIGRDCRDPVLSLVEPYNAAITRHAKCPHWVPFGVFLWLLWLLRNVGGISTQSP